MKRKGFRLKILPAKKASPPNSAPNLWNSLWGWITIGFASLGIKEILGSTLCTRIFLLFLLAVFNFGGVLWWTKIVIFGWKFFSKEHSPEFWSPDSYFWLPFTTRLFIQLDQGNFWRIVIGSWCFMVSRILESSIFVNWRLWFFSGQIFNMLLFSLIIRQVVGKTRIFCNKN